MVSSARASTECGSQGRAPLPPSGYGNRIVLACSIEIGGFALQDLVTKTRPAASHPKLTA
jgi:hypothetical protein